MKKTNLLILIGLLIGLSTFAQTEKLTVSDAIMQQYRKFRPEHISGVMPRTGTETFSFVKDYSKIYSLNKKGDTSLIAKLGDINKVLLSQGVKTLKYFPYWDYSWLSANQLKFTLDSKIIIFNTEKKEIDFLDTVSDNAKNITFCKKNQAISYTIDNNIFLDTQNNAKLAITNDANKGIVNGDGYVHRQEFGIDKGMWWAPNGKLLAFYRKDETMVADYPLVTIDTRIAEVNNLKYPMIGEKSEEVTLGIYNLATKKTVFAKVSDFTAEHYLTSITWDPNSQFIYIGVLNREQNHLKLNKYNALTGDFVKTLFAESNPKYVEPEHQLIFLKNSPDKFLWYSERDGYNHLYLYNTNGDLQKQVTKGNWVVTDFFGYDTKEKNIFIMSTKESPLERHAYKVSLKNGKMQQLTSGKGMHKVAFSDNKKFFTDQYSNSTTPNIVNLCKADGKIIKQLVKAKNPLANYNLGNIEIGTIKSADKKTDLYYRLILPPNFNPKKKYPTIVYVYGGPHAQLVTDSWLGGVSLWQFYMAQEGYVMFTVDNRGSANRGFEFESIIHRQCGQAEMADQMEGIKFLKNKPYVDANRIGVHGWSYGGFMTTSLVTNYPETFKVAVAGGPVIDWKYYEVMYGERYMDTPKENPEGFEKTSLLNKAGNLKGRLLMIHGYVDPVVVPQNSLDFVKHCIAAGTDVDYFLYPNSEHNMQGQTRVHLYNKVTRYFNDFLKPIKRIKE